MEYEESIEHVPTSTINAGGHSHTVDIPSGQWITYSVPVPTEQDLQNAQLREQSRQVLRMQNYSMQYGGGWSQTFIQSLQTLADEMAVKSEPKKKSGFASFIKDKGL